METGNLQHQTTPELVLKFYQNVPASFNAYDSLGDGYAAKGDKAKAIEAYKNPLQ